MEQQRCKHLMVAEWCGECHPPVISSADLGPIFSARYPGECAGDCGDVIAEGDQVRYVDDELMHAECAPDDDDEIAGWGGKLEVVK